MALPLPTVLVMAGGRGERLLPHSSVLPKPLVPIAPGLPMIEILLAQLQAAGFEDVHVAIRAGDDVTSTIVTRIAARLPRLRVGIVRESEPLGTAGAVNLLPRGLDDVLVVNGDVLTDLDFRGLVDEHATRSADLTTALREWRQELPVGSYYLGADALNVVGHSSAPVLTAFVAVGACVMTPLARSHVPTAAAVDVPVVVERLLAAGQHVSAFTGVFDAYDVGTPGGLDQARREFERDPGKYYPEHRGPAERLTADEAALQYAGLVLRDQDGRYLLQERWKERSVVLSTFGGVVEPGEGPVGTVLREVQEELGLHVAACELEQLGAFEALEGCSRRVRCTYFVLREPVRVDALRLGGEGVGVASVSLDGSTVGRMTEATTRALRLASVSGV